MTRPAFIAFPDLATDREFPELPPLFTDESWKNDVCAHFAAPSLFLEIWADHSDPTKREFPESPAYTLHSVFDGGETRAVIASSDYWPEIMVEVRAWIVRQINENRNALGACPDLDSHLWAALQSYPPTVAPVTTDPGEARVFGTQKEAVNAFVAIRAAGLARTYTVRPVRPGAVLLSICLPSDQWAYLAPERA